MNIFGSSHWLRFARIHTWLWLSARETHNEFLKCFESTNQQVFNCAGELLSISFVLFFQRLIDVRPTARESQQNAIKCLDSLNCLGYVPIMNTQEIMTVADWISLFSSEAHTQTHCSPSFELASQLSRCLPHCRHNIYSCTDSRLAQTSVVLILLHTVQVTLLRPQLTDC